MIKDKIKNFVPVNLWNELKKINQRFEYNNWLKNGKPAPPPHLVKQLRIKKYSEEYNIRILVETGTFLGDMVEAMKHNFEKVYSIELSHDLYLKAKKRFNKDSNISILEGDSGKVLFNLIKEIDHPAIFWLDGHYSEGETAKGEKECPIFEELEAIFNGKPFNHIILIDDARLFIGKGDYPTIDELTRFVKSKNNRYEITVEDDAICFLIKN